MSRASSLLLAGILAAVPLQEVIRPTANSYVLNDGSSLRTDTVDAHTASIQAYDVDDATYRSLATWTNGNTPDLTITPDSGASVVVGATRYTDAGSGLTVANVGANSCGTSAATVAGGSTTFTVTVGATAGMQCRVTFPTAAATRRGCTVSNETSAALARAAYVDTTNTDLLGTFGGGDVLAVVCFAR